MYRKEFKQQLNKTFKECIELVERKNVDYADSDNPFKNFEVIEKLGAVSTEKGILVRMTDKLTRISNLLDKEAKVQDETIKDTLKDLINYSSILLIYLDQHDAN